MSATHRAERRPAAELPRGNAPLRPGVWRPSRTTERPPCPGCGDDATALVFDRRGDYWTCGRSKCAPVYAPKG